MNRSKNISTMTPSKGQQLQEKQQEQEQQDQQQEKNDHHRKKHNHHHHQQQKQQEQQQQQQDPSPQKGRNHQRQQQQQQQQQQQSTDQHFTVQSKKSHKIDTLVLDDDDADNDEDDDDDGDGHITGSNGNSKGPKRQSEMNGDRTKDDPKRRQSNGKEPDREEIDIENEDDDDETEDEIDVMRQKADDAGNGEIEDICLSCGGACLCGGAKNKAIYVTSNSPSRKTKVFKATSPPPPTSTAAASSSAKNSGTGGASKSLRIKLTINNHDDANNANASTSKLSSERSKVEKAPSADGNIVLKKKKSSQKEKDKSREVEPSTTRARRSATSSHPEPDVNLSKRSKRGDATVDQVTSGKPKRTSKKAIADGLNEEETQAGNSDAMSSNTTRKNVSTTNKKTNQTTSNPDGRGNTPSRMSLRQVIAASTRDASGSSAPASPSSSRDRNDATKCLKREQREPLSDVSDLDLSDLGTSDEGEGAKNEADTDGEEDEDDLEKAEERALREEFQGSSGDDDEEDDDDDDDEIDDDEDDNDLSSLTTDEDDEVLNFGDRSGRWIGGRGTRGRRISREGSFLPEEELEHDEELAITDLPPSGGRGVVTWSDYDSDGEDDDDNDAAAEFEDELDELLAISEAVVGPVRDDDEYELGDMWFEEIDDLDAGDNEVESGDADSEDEDGVDEDEQDLLVGADDQIIYMNGWHSSFLNEAAQSGSSESDDSDDFDEEMYFYDDDSGDTTDSLDSDDHDGLVRFGIEVDSDAESSSSSAGSDVYKHSRHAPGTASLADVQAPTSADLASLPQHLFSDGIAHIKTGTTTDIFKSQSHFSPPIPPKKEKDGHTPIINGAQKQPKKKSKKIVSIQKGEEVDDLVNSAQSPAMGIFVPKDNGRKAKEMVVMIDGSGNMAPSPFTKLRRGKKRGRDLLDETPSRRMRSDSKISTTTSATDGSLSGDVPEVTSPFIPSVIMNFDLDDVLHESVLGGDDESQSTSSGSGVDGTKRKKKSQKTSHALSDLTRWSRVPIGAFRSSTMPSFRPNSQYFNATVEERTSSGTLYIPIASSILRGSAAPSSLSHTLSSPHSHGVTTKRAIERRMLTSPVFGPSMTSSSPIPVITPSSPKSRKMRRKEKKTNMTRDLTGSLNGHHHSSVFSRNSPAIQGLHVPTPLVI